MKKLISTILILTLTLALAAAPCYADVSYGTWYTATLDGTDVQFLWSLVAGVATRDDGAQLNAYMTMCVTPDGPCFTLYPDERCIPDSPMINHTNDVITNPAHFESDMGLSSDFSIAVGPNSETWCMFGNVGGMSMSEILTRSLRMSEGYGLYIPMIGWAGRSGEKWVVSFYLKGFGSNFREVYDNVAATW